MLVSLILIILLIVLISFITNVAINYPSPYPDKKEVKKGVVIGWTLIYSCFLAWITQFHIFNGYIETFYYVLFFTTMYILAWIDYCFGILPNKINLSASVAAIVVAIVETRYNYSSLLEVSLSDRIMGVLAVAIFMLILSLFSGETKIGGGDIKLLIWVGIALGVKYMLIGFVVSCLIALLISLFLSIKKLKYVKKIRFGPSLAAGYVITIMYGDSLFQMYLKLAGF